MYKDFVYVHEKDKLDRMGQDYNSAINSLQTSPIKNNLPFKKALESEKVPVKHQTHYREISFASNPLNSSLAVHPIDNTSEKEPEQPGIAPKLTQGDVNNDGLDYVANGGTSYGNKTTNTFKSQDDIEPVMPMIGSEFQSGSRQECEGSILSSPDYNKTFNDV